MWSTFFRWTFKTTFRRFGPNSRELSRAVVSTNGFRRSTYLLAVLAFPWPFKTPEEPKPESVTRQLFAASLKSLATRDFVKADETLHELLRHLYDSSEKGLIDRDTYVTQRARVCSEMANINLLMGEYEAAERLVKQVIQDCVDSHVSTSDAMIVELSLKLALIYEKLGTVDKADLGFKYCIENQEEKIGRLNDDTDKDQIANEKALLGMCYNYYSKFLFFQGNYDSALSFAKKGLDMATQLYPPEHPNCLNLRCDIAVIEAQQNHFDSAREHLMQAAKEAERSFSLIAPKDKENVPSESDALGACLIHILLQLASVEVLADQREAALKAVAEAESILPKLSSSSSSRKKIDQFVADYGL
ncbi:unnamed protein product [Calicophoron daubneyi]|uniref:Uncharacterized protein n=1 Tax=Calicophoron daubneyi TaxID=300641 RepID=A0AAV2TEC8_CALDB